MKKKLLPICGLLLSFAFLITSSCKKADPPAPPATTATTTTPDPNPEKTSSSDEVELQAASDDALADANGSLSSSPNAKMEVAPIKGATIDSLSTKGAIKITYSGVGEDPNKSRSGVITLTRLTASIPWRYQGSVYRIDFTNYMTTKVATGKSITLNGYKIFTNVNGGRLSDLYNYSLPNPTLVFRAKGNLTITFDDGTKRDWFVARKTTYVRTGSGSNYIIDMKVEGDSLYKGISNVVEGGTNRNNEAFYNVISTPFEVRSNCAYGKLLIAGVRQHYGDRTYTMTFGLDASGNPLTSGACPTTRTFRIDWTGKDGLPKSTTITN
jgi:hypothetical protein